MRRNRSRPFVILAAMSAAALLSQSIFLPNSPPPPR